MKTNYIATVWTGHRSAMHWNLDYEKDRTHYIRKVIHKLSRIKHHLDQITFVIPGNPEEPENFTEFIKGVPVEIKGARVEVIRTKYVPVSYEAYYEVGGMLGGF